MLQNFGPFFIQKNKYINVINTRVGPKLWGLRVSKLAHLWPTFYPMPGVFDKLWLWNIMVFFKTSVFHVTFGFVFPCIISVCLFIFIFSEIYDKKVLILFRRINIKPWSNHWLWSLITNLAMRHNKKLNMHRWKDLFIIKILRKHIILLDRFEFRISIGVNLDCMWILLIIA